MDIKAPTNTRVQVTITNTGIKLRNSQRFMRLRMGLALAVVDALVILLSSAMALVIWSFVRDDLILSFYVPLIPLVLVFVLVYFLSGLYFGIGVNPVEELRQQTIATVLTFLGLGFLSFWFRNAESYSRASFILATIFSIILLPIARELLRSFLAARGWWGEPVAIIGFSKQGEEILDFLQKNPQLGLNPVVLFNGFHPESHQAPADIPLVSAQGLLNEQYVRQLKGISTAILIEQDLPEDFLQAVVQEYGFRFANLILISNTKRFGSLWVIPMDIGGVLGLRVRQNLMSGWQQLLKRLVDLAIIFLFSPVLLLLLACIALLVRIDSKGRILYGHTRIGQHGKPIKVWKFRTMVSNADEVLETYLETNPEARKEWEANRKIKFDPRITRMGKFLRKSSLDELPQVWNVLKGEMSLVGPRPIIDAEVKYYQNYYKMYLQVKPGITGLWQISGRNNLDYPTRVRLDEYYVRNWSFWFDIYIITHTPVAILTGKGAY